MTYNIKKYNGSALIPVPDGVVDTTYGVTLIGKNYAGYGIYQNENFVHLLENFANSVQPQNPLPGQIWFDTFSNKLKFYDITNTWKPAGGGAQLSATEPTTAAPGDLWFNTNTNQLYVWSQTGTIYGAGYVLVGPSTLISSNSAITEFKAENVTDTLGYPKPVIKGIVNGATVLIISEDATSFTLQSGIASTPVGFTTIHKGINLVGTDPNTGISSVTRYWGTSSDADRLNGQLPAFYAPAATPTFTGLSTFSDTGLKLGTHFSLSNETQNSVISNSTGDITFKSNNFSTFKISNEAILPGGTLTGTISSIDIGSTAQLFSSVYTNNIVGDATLTTSTANVFNGTNTINFGTTANNKIIKIGSTDTNNLISLGGIEISNTNISSVLTSAKSITFNTNKDTTLETPLVLSGDKILPGGTVTASVSSTEIGSATAIFAKTYTQNITGPASTASLYDSTDTVSLGVNAKTINIGTNMVTGGNGIVVGTADATVTFKGTLIYEGAALQNTVTQVTSTYPVIAINTSALNDSNDVGFYAEYFNVATKYTGLIRESNDKKWSLFSETTDVPSNGITTDFNLNKYDGLRLGSLEVYGNTSSLTNTAIGLNSMVTGNGTALGIGTFNTAVGNASLQVGNKSAGNTAIGYSAMQTTTTGANNVAIGRSTLLSNTIGSCNVAIGYNAMNQTVLANDIVAIGAYSFYTGEGAEDVAIGTCSLYNNNGGTGNIAIGKSTSQLNTTGANNIAIGPHALCKNQIGVSNIGIGIYSLCNNLTSYNIGIGDSSLKNTTNGSHNIGIGACSLFNNTLGDDNIGIGLGALQSNIDGDYNISLGRYSLATNQHGVHNIGMGTWALNAVSGSFNVAIGTCAMKTSTSGCSNIAIGFSSMGDAEGNCNIAIGPYTLQKNSITGCNNIAIGVAAMQASVTGDNNIVIGVCAMSTGDGSNNIVLGTKAAYNNKEPGLCNIAIGTCTLFTNQNGDSNIAIGNNALFSNIVSSNLGIGLNALYYNTTGYNNSAVGNYAGYCNISGRNNTAVGTNALKYNMTGDNNVAIGTGALLRATGSSNVAVGTNAQYSTRIGGGNVAVGHYASFGMGNSFYNTAIGYQALDYTMSSKNNTAIGYQAMTDAIWGKWQAPLGSGLAQVGTVGSPAWKPASGTNYTATTGAYLPAIQTQAVTISVTDGVLDTASIQGLGLSETFLYCQVKLLYESNFVAGQATDGSGRTRARGTLSREKGSATGAALYEVMYRCRYDISTGKAFIDFNSTAENLTTVMNAIYYVAVNIVQWTGSSAIGFDAQVPANNTMVLGGVGTTVYLPGGSTKVTSDMRDKADIRDTILGLAFINKLRPVDYKWDHRSDYVEKTVNELGEPTTITYEKDGSRKRNRYHHGIITQEIEAIIKETGVDFGGFMDATINGGLEQQALGYDEFIGPMIKAIQELTATVEELKQQLPK